MKILKVTKYSFITLSVFIKSFCLEEYQMHLRLMQICITCKMLIQGVHLKFIYIRKGGGAKLFTKFNSQRAIIILTQLKLPDPKISNLSTLCECANKWNILINILGQKFKNFDHLKLVSWRNICHSMRYKFV